MLVCLLSYFIGAGYNATGTRLARPWDVCVRRCLLPQVDFFLTGAAQAGIVIAQEAGGFVTGSKDAPHDGVVTEAILTGRRYLVIRGVGGSAVRAGPRNLTEMLTRGLICCHTVSIHPFIHPFVQEESSLDVQKRLAREFYDTVEDIPLDDD